MTRPTLAIIGNGMATACLLDDLASRGGLRKYAVNVYGEEPHGTYNRILLGRVLMGGDIDDITLKSAEWYAEKGVRFFPGVRVTRLARGTNRLWTNDGQEHYFDTAVFATGSSARVPKIDGLTGPGGALKPGAFTYRTVDDVDRMRLAAKPGRRAAVVGGGLLGLEAAKGLADLGLAVTVVHLFDTLMNRQVDKTGGLFLRRAFERIGIAVRTGLSTKRVLGDGAVTGLEFGGGERLAAEVVVFASGVAPRVDLARDAEVRTNAGILVTDQFRTSLEGVYAVGECAEHNGKVYGTVQPIYDQCRVLADVLCDPTSRAAYRGSKVYTKLKVAGIEVASMGRIDGDRADDEVVQVVEEARGVYRKLVIEGGRLAGAVLVGDSSAAAGLVRLFDDGTPLPANRLDLFASGDAIPGVGGGDPEVCNCHHVPTSALVGAIRGGCVTLPALAERTRAGTGCGSCRGQLANLIFQHAPKVAAGDKG